MDIGTVGTLGAALMSVFGSILTGVAAIYVPRAVTALETSTGVALTDQQRQVVMGAVQTAAGMVGSYLDRGVIQPSDVHEMHPVIGSQALAVINAVPEAAGALGMTVEGLSRMIVSRVARGTPPAPLEAASWPPPSRKPAAVVAGGDAQSATLGPVL